ncbi:MAG: hypothetical protein O3A84_12145 [Proteobacteria bacterium]|nr:hypothetical protein [Pseudomonadota bacterium]
MENRYDVTFEKLSGQFVVVDNQFGVCVVSRHADEGRARRLAERAERKWRFSIKGLGPSEIYQMYVAV